MTSCITKSTINLWDTLPKELCYIIWEYNVIPYLDELKDKQLVRSILLERRVGRSDYWLMRHVDMIRDYRWVGSMGWKEITPCMKQMCKENGVKGYSKKKKNELINILIKL